MIKQLYWVWIFPFVLFFSTWVIYFCFCYYSHYSPIFNSYGGIIPSFKSLKFWLNIILVSGICFILDYFFHFIYLNFSVKLSNELMINREYKNNINALLEHSEIIQNAFNKFGKREVKKEKNIISKHSSFLKKNSSSQKNSFKRKSSSESYNSSSSRLSGQNIEIIKNYSSKKYKKNEGNSSFASSKEEMLENKNELKTLNSNIMLNSPIKTPRNTIDKSDNNENINNNVITISRYKHNNYNNNNEEIKSNKSENKNKNNNNIIINENDDNNNTQCPELLNIVKIKPKK